MVQLVLPAQGLSAGCSQGISPKALSSEHLKLAWAAGAVSKMAHLHGCWQATAIPHHMNLFIGLLDCPHSMAAGFPQTKGKNEKEATRASSDQVSEVIHHYFHHIPFIRSKSLHPVHTHEKGIKSHLLKRGGSTNFWICFKTVTPLYPSSSPYDPDKWQAKRT